MGIVRPDRFFSSYLLFLKFSSVPKRDTYSPLIFREKHGQPVYLQRVGGFYILSAKRADRHLFPYACRLV